MATNAPQVIIITGMSGAGKSTALKALEDAGFYGIDNLPVALLAHLAADGDERRYALVMDARDTAFLAGFAGALAELQARGVQPEVLFLDATDATLQKRYSALRRRHPLGQGSVAEGVRMERRLLGSIASLAGKKIDTTLMSPHRLASDIVRQYGNTGCNRGLQTTILSFGFKYGPPTEADVLFDVRFLPNPYFVPELKEKTGQEQAVSEYVLASPVGHEFMEKLLSLLHFLIPQYQQEGKVYLTIGIGCTGGKHRSVAVAEALRRKLAASIDTVSVIHRQLDM